MAKMYHLRYAVVSDSLSVVSEEKQQNDADNQQLATDNSITIATSRPETIMADVAVAVNPNDPRYQHLIGQKLRIPLLGREIPIIVDEYVSIDFGTGALKVTPAHDLNDYELGVKHNLPVIDILSNDGTLNEKAVLYVGQDRFAARRNIVKDLEEAGLLVKVEEYASIVQTSERTKAVIEPKPEPAVVHENGAPGQARPRGSGKRHRAAAPGQVQEHLPGVDGERARLVHLAPALVGPADSGLLPARWHLRGGPHGR